MCIRFVVRGRVQGVGFRFATREEARRLALTGRVRNLPDGSVEAIACGDPQRLESLARWLGTGPRLARVDSVEREAAPGSRFEDFAIG